MTIGETTSSSPQDPESTEEVTSETEEKLSKLEEALDVFKEEGGIEGFFKALATFFGKDNESDTPQDTERAQEVIASSTGIDVKPDGTVDREQLRQYITQKIAGTRLNGFVPRDGAMYGITTGSPQEWANFMTALARKESDYRTRAVGDVGVYDGNSNGLFQLSPNDAPNYDLGNPFTLEQLQDPVTNTDAAIIILERLVLRDGVIADKTNSTRENPGASAYWGPLRRGWTPAEEGMA